MKAGLVLAIALAAVFGYLYFNEKQQTSQQNVTLTEKTQELLRTNTKLDSISSELDAKIAEITALGGQVDEGQAVLQGQFLHAQPDGPVAFHYPAPTYRDDMSSR